MIQFLINDYERNIILNYNKTQQYLPITQAFILHKIILKLTI